jgi:hypothetical protein
LLIASEGLTLETPLKNINYMLPRIQRLNDEELLIVDVRGYKKDLENAHVHSSDGAHRRSFHLSATEDVFVGSDGSIWASFDDESAFNSPALMRLDEQGRMKWGFIENRGEAASVWMFYALNVANGCVWACGYTEFEVVRIENDVVKHWAQDIGGVDELASNGTHVLMLGAYHEGNPRFWLGRLGDDAIEDLTEVWITLPDGRELADLWRPRMRRDLRFQVIGRHDALHVFAENGWYRVTVDEALSSSEEGRRKQESESTPGTSVPRARRLLGGTY